MFNFFRKKAEVLNHWIAFCDGFQMTPSEFYAELETELQARTVPRMEMSQISFSEGGLLSEKRTYLRMLRERIVFDVCAAPFGTGFFFSCRTAEIPLVIKPLQLIAVFLLSMVFLNLALRFLGFFDGIFVCFIALVASIYLMRNAVALGLQDLDRLLIQSPIIGTIYEIFFREQTYHRVDSRLCFIHAVPTIVKQLAEQATAEKGLKLIEQYEQSPILGELYKPSPPFFGRESNQPVPV